VARVLTYLICAVAVFGTTLIGQAASPASSAGPEQEIARLEKD
jgi:hypothetical protein